MSDELRRVRLEEFDELMRTLDVAFAWNKNFFVQTMPHLYHADAEACGWNHAIFRDGRIVSVVGVFPVPVVNAGVTVCLGGIGGVSALPSERKHGHMTRLMQHVIPAMREDGYCLSALSGDRQRYGAFGWELAGVVRRLQFSQRSLDRAGVKAVPVEEVTLPECLDAIRRLWPRAEFHSLRPRLEWQVTKTGVRAWLCEDGYAAGWREGNGTITLAEIASSSGREAGMVAAIRERANAASVAWPIPAHATGTLTRVLPAASRWSTEDGGMYRIMDLAALLRLYAGVLGSRLGGLSDFSVTVGIREPDGRLQEAGIAAAGGVLNVTSGKGAGPAVELDSHEAVRLFIGGPPGPKWDALPPGLRHILPLPMFIPPLDHF